MYPNFFNNGIHIYVDFALFSLTLLRSEIFNQKKKTSLKTVDKKNDGHNLTKYHWWFNSNCHRLERV